MKKKVKRKVKKSSGNEKVPYVFLVLILILTGFTSYFSYVENHQKTYPEAFLYTDKTITELRSENFPKGFYNIKGYVIEERLCPRCPDNVFCKPCDAYIRVFELNPEDVTTALSLPANKDKIVKLQLTPKATDKFDKDDYYELSVLIFEEYDEIERQPSLKLIGYSQVKEE